MRSRAPAPSAHGFWRFVFPAALVVAAAAVVLLAVQGGRTLITQRIGQVSEPFRYQPDEPGYLELVAATPTLLVLHTSDSELAGATFMARTGIDAGGGIVLLPADVAVTPPGSSADGGESLAASYSRGGAVAVQQLAEGLFGLGFDSVIEVSTEEMAAMMSPVGSLPYVILDDLVELAPDGAARVTYEAGRTDLSSVDAAAVYAFRNPNEADVNRLERQRAMWVAWLEAIGGAEDPSAAVAASGDRLGPFLRALSAGTTVVEAPPIQTVLRDDGSLAQHVLAGDGRAWLRNRSLDLVPWPAQPSSFWRPRVKLLDGTGRPAARDALVDDVVAAGGVITVIGNAAAFGVESTNFAYHRPELVTDPIVNTIAFRLGLDMSLVEAGEEVPGLVDVTLTVGLDRVPQ